MKKAKSRKASVVEPSDIASLALHVDVAEAIAAMKKFTDACKAAGAAYDELRAKMGKDVKVKIQGAVRPEMIVPFGRGGSV